MKVEGSHYAKDGILNETVNQIMSNLKRLENL